MNEPVLQSASVLPYPNEFFDPQWYVLFVRSNQEKRVARGLNERGIEHLLPCYSSLRHWKDRRVRLDYVNNRPDSLDVYIKGRKRAK